MVTPFAKRARRSWPERVAVSGDSMVPTLRPGDWVLVDPAAYREGPPRPRDLVVVPDPRETSRMLVKRVSSVDVDGRLLLAGDDPERSTDSRAFGAVDPAAVVGAPWFRYWPVRRAGFVG